MPDAEEQAKEQQAEDKSEEKAKPKGKPKDNVAALQASLNRQADQFKNERDGLSEQVTELQKRLGDAEAREADVEALAEAAKLADDPEKLGLKYKEAHAESLRLRQRAQDAERKLREWGNKGLSYAARARAAEILMGAEGSEQLGKLAAELEGAQSESELDRLATRLTEKLQALAELTEKPASSDDDETEIDGGGASAGRRSLLSDMEGMSLKEFEEKRSELKRRLLAQRK